MVAETERTNDNGGDPIAERLARGAVDNLFKRAKINQDQQQPEEKGPSIDPEIQKKIVDREIKMAADPDFELQELAKERAAQRMRQVTRSSVETPDKPPKSEAQIIEEERRRRTDELMGESTRRMEQAKNLYNACIDSGGSPAMCSKMVADLMEVKKEPTAPPATSISELVHSLKELDAMRGPKIDPELTKLLTKMDERLTRLEERKPEEKREQPKRTIVVIKADGSFQEVEDGHPIIIEKKVMEPNESNESLERKILHEEKDRELKIAEAKLKNNKEIAGSVVENLSNIASALIEGRSTTPAAASSVPATRKPVTQYITCKGTEETPGCGFKIPFTGTPEEITCPQCGFVYSLTGPGNGQAPKQAEPKPVEPVKNEVAAS